MRNRTAAMYCARRAPVTAAEKPGTGLDADIGRLSARNRNVINLGKLLCLNECGRSIAQLPMAVTAHRHW
ncbi:MAG: hypothetical protein ACREEM_04765 [Blastocatellia bacterium]